MPDPGQISRSLMHYERLVVVFDDFFDGSITNDEYDDEFPDNSAHAAL